MVAHDLDCLLNPTASRYDILRYNESLTRVNYKSATQHKTPISVFLSKDMPLAEMAGYFLADDNPAHCWRNDGFCIVGAELVRKHTAHARRYGRVLEQEGALEKLAAVKPATQDKVAMKQGAGLFEKIEDVLHGNGFPEGYAYLRFLFAQSIKPVTPPPP